jgi:hypothetical protein
VVASAAVLSALRRVIERIEILPFECSTDIRRIVVFIDDVKSYTTSRIRHRRVDASAAAIPANDARGRRGEDYIGCRPRFPETFSLLAGCALPCLDDTSSCH